MIDYIKNLFTPFILNDRVYLKYVDSGKIDEVYLRIIAAKIIKQKPLTDLENSLFKGETKRINELITQMVKIDDTDTI
jgi:hypothetical protein